MSSSERKTNHIPEAAPTAPRAQYQLTSIVPAIILFFCLGVGLSFGVALLSLGVSGFEKEAVAVMQPQRSETASAITARTLPANSMAVPVSVAERPTSSEHQASAISAPVISAPSSTVSTEMKISSPLRVGAPETNPHYIFANAANFFRSVASAQAVQRAPGSNSEHGAATTIASKVSVCETAHSACVDMCPDGGSFGAGFDAGLEDETEICESACADGRVRCQRSEVADSCGNFLGACRYKCTTESFNTDDCEDACELAQASCVTALKSQSDQKKYF